MAKLKLTPELQAEICEKIAAVATFREAVLLTGLDESTAYKWLKRGETDKRGKFRQFFMAVKRANAQCIVGIKAGIRVHGKKDWRALQAIGAMKAPKQFVPQLRLHVTSELEGALERLHEAFKDQPEMYELALRAISRGMDGEDSGESDESKDSAPESE